MAKIMQCTMEQYLSDPCSEPSLNASIANTLLQKSPAHAFLEHPQFGGMGKEPTKEMDNGTLIHTLLLGAGKEIVVVSADNWRTNLARETRDEQRSLGKVPILEKDWDAGFTAASRIKIQLSDLDIHLDQGCNELKIHFKSDGANCRRALDSWNEPLLTIYELKTIMNAHPNSCATQALRMGYDVEYSASIDAIQRLYPEHAGKIDFLFIFCEIKEPYAVYVCRPDGVFSHLGDQKWKKAKAIWNDCIKTNNWPAYGESIGSLTAPLWAAKELIEEGDYEPF